MAKYRVELSITKVIEVDVTDNNLYAGEDPSDVAEEIAIEKFWQNGNHVVEDNGFECDSIQEVD